MEKKPETEEISNKKPKKYEEVTTPFFLFQKIGDSIEGILLDKKEYENFYVYTIKKYDGNEIKFHGTTQLDDLLNFIECPTHIKVIFNETKPSNYGSDIKLFKVFKASNF